MKDVENVRDAVARLSDGELRRLATTARVPIADLRRFAAGDLDDLKHVQFVDTRAALRKMLVMP